MSTWQYRASCLVAALFVAAALGACGKKGPLKPPEGEAANYTYPGSYPATIDEEKPPPEPAPLPPGASAPSKLSPFPSTTRTTPTRTYGSE